MFGTPQSEHNWLDQLVGDWKAVSECEMPGGKKEQTEGTMSCRSVGGLWLVGEGTGESAEQGSWSSIMTLGFDPARERYVGNFIASVMTHQWLYEGTVNEEGNILALDTEGPKFTGDGTARYQDRIEIVNDDHWVMSSHMLGDDGNWQQIMRADHHRKS